MIPPPKSRWIRFLSVPYSYEVIVAFFLVLGGVANSIRGFSPESGNLVGTFWAISAIGVFFVSLAKSWVLWTLVEDRESTHELSGCLHVLHSLLTSGPDRPPCRLRMTIYVPVDGGSSLQQILDYVGAKYPGRKVGRKFPVGAGIIGMAYRERAPKVADRRNQDPDLFIRELQADWGYSEADALQVDTASQCWMADSTVPGFFDDTAQNIMLAPQRNCRLCSAPVSFIEISVFFGDDSYGASRATTPGTRNRHSQQWWREGHRGAYC